MSRIENRSPSPSPTSKLRSFPAHSTSSKDPKDVASRVFVGNVPTESIDQSHMHEIFSSYGEITGISLHKGFAFVQFKDEVAARRSIHGEQGRILAGRRLDMCISNERKKSRPSPPRSRGGDFRPPAFIDDLLPYPRDRDLHGFGHPRPPMGIELPAVARMEAKVIVIERTPRLMDYAEMIFRRLSKLGLNCSMAMLDKHIETATAIDIASKAGVLYAACVNIENEVHSSVTLYILHGHAQEHRNMPIEDSFKLVASNFDEYMRKLSEEVDPISALSEDSSGIVGDIDPAISLIMLNLAEGKQVDLKQLDKVLAYLMKKREAMGGSKKKDDPIGAAYNKIKNEDRTGPIPMPVQAPEDVKKKQQADDLQAKITQLFGDKNKQQHTVGITASIKEPPISEPTPMPELVADASAKKFPIEIKLQKPPFKTEAKKSTGIDFTNPTVQQALKNLIKTGPNILDKVRSQSTTEKSFQSSNGNKSSSGGNNITLHEAEESGRKIPTVEQSYHQSPRSYDRQSRSPKSGQSNSSDYYYGRERDRRDIERNHRDYERDHRDLERDHRDLERDHRNLERDDRDFSRDDRDFSRDDRAFERHHRDLDYDRRERDHHSRDRERRDSSDDDYREPPKSKRAKPGRPTIAGFF